MRLVFLALTPLLFLLQPILAQDTAPETAQSEAVQPDPPLADLLSTREMVAYERNPNYKRRMDVFTDALKRYTLLLRSQVDTKRVGELLGTLGRLRALAHHAIKEKPPLRKKDLKSGQVRELEIRIRKLNEEIEDAKTIAPFEYHDDFQATLDDLVTLRTQLLKQLFGPGLTGREGEETGSFLSLPSRTGGATFGFASAAAAQETRYSTEIAGDQFTPDEVQKIRDHQNLGKRVGILLDIAETRLAEIKRRMNKLEWTGKEANPLEFYTFEQMIHAYERALNSAMINIDEKAHYKLATQKQIRKTLEKLGAKLDEFEPQLAPVKEYAVQTKDQILYREIIRAEKTNGIARKGVVYGLGAPPTKSEK